METAELQPVEEPSEDSLPEEEPSVKPERAAPERIGRYELCFELASGGMASVFLARMDGASGFEKLVALKRIHRHLAKERKYIEMFLDEAKIASRITHPNVCTVFDFGEADGEYYLAMEYLVGEPVSRVCGRVAKSPEQRRDSLLPMRMACIIADACEGLHAAHELKDAHGDLLHVVHRDVSPRNLFLTYDGAVQVVDFGIASARQRMHHTSTGQVKGTFAYMAPEQLTSAPIDRRVDVWSLGVTLWEMLAVKRLFRRETTAETIHAVLYDELLPPSEYRTQIPEELDAIVLKALARNPDERWQTAREMGRALRQFLAQQSQLTGAPELSEWLGELFPQGEARKSQLMEVARLADKALPAVPHGNEMDATYTATREVVDDDPPQRKPLAPRPRYGLLATALVAIVGALGWVLGTAPRRTTEETTPLDTTVHTAQDAVSPVPDDEDAPSTAEEEGLRLAPTPNLGPKPSGSSGSDPEPTTRDDARRVKEPPRATMGQVDLVTRGGWAKVYKGQKLLGSTPTRLTLPEGRHRLVLKAFGEGAPKPILVQVEAGKTRKVAVPLN